MLNFHQSTLWLLFNMFQEMLLFSLQMPFISQQTHLTEPVFFFFYESIFFFTLSKLNKDQQWLFYSFLLFYSASEQIVLLRLYFNFQAGKKTILYLLNESFSYEDKRFFSHCSKMHSATSTFSLLKGRHNNVLDASAQKFVKKIFFGLSNGKPLFSS